VASAQPASPLLGRRAEAAAAAHLEAKGFRIVARNWRPPAVSDGEPGEQPRAGWTSELDLVADDAGTCVFVEVRARTGADFGHPLEAISAHKRARVVRAARHYLACEAPRASGFRFDVVGVLYASADAPPECFHVANAFDADGVIA
jgi:putative endonuclease